MSFVITEPEPVTTAAQDLAGIRTTLGAATASAASPTTGIAAAAADEVSTAVAAVFGTYGREFQALGAQAAAFHDQFTNLLNASSGAYIGAEVANAKQNLLNAVHAPAQAVSGAVANAPASLRALETAVAPTLAGSAGNGFAATVAGPYETLFANTAANLQSLGNTIAANPVPFLHQLITNQMAYGQLVATSLQHAATDFGAGLAALPAAFQAAYQALVAGDVSGAVSILGKAFVNLFVTGFDTSNLNNIVLLGSVGDLLPILTIPGAAAQNFANVINTLTDTTISANVSAFSINIGLPMALAFDALGSPATTLTAVGQSATAFFDAVQAGNPQAALTALVNAPAVVANGFLNGEQVYSRTLNVSIPFVKSVVLNIPLDGILVPLQPLTVTVTPVIGNPSTIVLTGTPLGGIVPALVTYAPEQLAKAITPD